MRWNDHRKLCLLVHLSSNLIPFQVACPTDVAMAPSKGSFFHLPAINKWAGAMRLTKKSLFLFQ